MPYIDAHMHFWDRSLMPYTWLHEVPSIWDRHAPENLRAEAGKDLPRKSSSSRPAPPGSMR